MPDTYGIRVWDAQGQLGPEVVDALSLCVFADQAMVSVDTVVTDIPPNVQFIQVFLFLPTGPISQLLPYTYNATTHTLTFRNNSFSPSTFVMATVW